MDYWNLQLTLQQEDAKQNGINPVGSHRVNIDWFGLGPWLVQKAMGQIKQEPGLQQFNLNFQETRIYTSANPNDNGAYKHWVTNTLGKRPGTRVFCADRKPKRNQICPSCNCEISACNHCSHPINATQEKGVDTLLVTDLLRLGLDQTYEVAIIASQDADMKPAIDHLSSKGIKVIHAGVKHFGSDVSKSCWAKFDIFPSLAEIKRS